MNTISAVTVERDEGGFWLHPVLDKLLGEREGFQSGEFEAWLDANNLEAAYDYWSEEDTDTYRAYVVSGSFAAWQPEPPAGSGWFISSIHDSEEDGPLCIWLRNRLCGDDTSKENLAQRIAELESLLLVDVPETVWPAEVNLAFSKVQKAEKVLAHHQHRLKYHINRMLLEGLPLPSVITAASSLADAMEDRQ
ncbi:hypothetical protein [Atlantibacter hermannii]|uniref:hypothetical protein n=1 Tax=Atlantibacter hermannii TaxID=565 RepID=UPI00289CA5ED|nr:hypothetical protein [Atlantibacter hermannii]